MEKAVNFRVTEEGFGMSMLTVGSELNIGVREKAKMSHFLIADYGNLPRNPILR